MCAQSTVRTLAVTGLIQVFLASALPTEDVSTSSRLLHRRKEPEFDLEKDKKTRNTWVVAGGIMGSYPPPSERDIHILLVNSNLLVLYSRSGGSLYSDLGFLAPEHHTQLLLAQTKSARHIWTHGWRALLQQQSQ